MLSCVNTLKYSPTFWETGQYYAKLFISKGYVQCGALQTTKARHLGHDEQRTVALCQHTTTRRPKLWCARTVEAPAIAGKQTVRLHATTPTGSRATKIVALNTEHAPRAKTRPTIGGLVARRASAPRRTLGRTFPQALPLPPPSRSDPEKQVGGFVRTSTNREHHQP